MKRKLSFLLVLILVLVSLFGCGGGQTPPAKDPVQVKNVILFIGDGMGDNHLLNTLLYYDMEEPEFFNSRYGYFDTSSHSHEITDSAAAATALATGQRVNNGNVARFEGEDIVTIAELAKAAGKRVGIVTTENLTGATPAGFSSHANDRNDADDITLGQATSGFDLFIGDDDARATYKSAHMKAFTENGYFFMNSLELMRDSMEYGPIVAAIPGVRSKYNDGHENDTQLQDITQFAIDYLTCEEGFFLMVESAHIDKYSHNNNLFDMMAEARTFMETIQFFYDTLGADTAILVTADHETGGLKLAETKEELSDKLYTKTDHSATNVSFFAKNFPSSLSFSDVELNTYMFTIIKTILNLE